MKAIAIDRFGGDDGLRLVNLPAPRPKRGEMLVRIRSAGVGIWDEMYIRGEIRPEHPRFPLVPGWEGAGIVLDTGPGASRFKNGDSVFFYHFPDPDNPGGTWAEQARIPVESAALTPQMLSAEQAGGLPIIALTAYQALRDGLGLGANQSLLILNGAGGVGTMAIQLAKLQGARVLALASALNHALVRQLGAERAYDYHDSYQSQVRCDFAQGVDCVFDDSGNPETVAKAMACLKPGGTFLSIVDRYKDLERDDVRNRYFDARPSGADLAELARLVDAGKLRLLVDRVFPVEKAREALAKVEDGHVHGKVVLKVA